MEIKKRFKKIFVLTASFVLMLVFFIGAYNIYKLSQQRNTDGALEAVDGRLQYYEDFVTLVKKDSKGQETIIDSASQGEKIATWHEYLFFSQTSVSEHKKSNKEKISIYSYNLNNNVKELIYDSERDDSDLNPDYLSELAVIGDKLYWAVGQYILQTSLYQKDLNKSENFQKVTSLHYPRLITDGENYIIHGSIGDAGLTLDQYQAFDPNTGQIAPKIELSTESGSGKMFLGFHQGSIVVADCLNNGNIYEEIDVERIYLLDYKNLQERDAVEKSKFPKNANGVTFNQSTGKLAILGDTLKIVDLYLDSDKEISTTEDLSDYYIANWSDENNLCFGKNIITEEGANNLIINLNGTKKEIAERCYGNSIYIKEKNEKDTFLWSLRQIDLPSNFEYTVYKKLR